MELCRVCIRSHPEMVSLFDKKEQQENDIITRIQFCSGVLFTKEKNLPTKICKRCLKALSIAHNFKRKCLNSRTVIENLKVKNVKSEPFELNNISNDITLQENTESYKNISVDKVYVKYNDPFENDGFGNDRNCVKDDINCENVSKTELVSEESVWTDNLHNTENFKAQIVKTESREIHILPNNLLNKEDDLKNNTENYINVEIDNKCGENDDLMKNDRNENNDTCVKDDQNDDDFFKSEIVDDDVWPVNEDFAFDEDLLQEGENNGPVLVKNNAKSKSVCFKKNPSNSEKISKKRGPYNKNKNTHHKLKKLKFKRLACEICDLKFVSKKDSDEHKKKFHYPNARYMCEICGKMMLPQSFTYHIRSHLPAKLACDSCDYKSNNKQDLAKHMRIHTNSKAWYICPVCATTCRTSSNLHTHVRMKHGGKPRFPCVTCGRAFHDRTKLSRHLDSHNHVKRHCCEVCNACFTRRCYWKKHLQKEHGITIPAVRPGRQRAQVRDLRLLEG